MTTSTYALTRAEENIAAALLEAVGGCPPLETWYQLCRHSLHFRQDATEKHSPCFTSLEGGLRQNPVLQLKILTFQRMSVGNGTVNLKTTKLSYGKEILKTNSSQDENQSSLPERKDYVTAMM